MIPKEGRVSDVSFEQDRKQAARRYYDLRSATIDSCNDCTNVITFSSQSPSWFFPPKELNISLKECLHEVNYCENSFIKESFTTASNLSSLNLNHQISQISWSWQMDPLSHFPWTWTTFQPQICPFCTRQMESSILWWTYYSYFWTGLHVQYLASWCVHFPNTWQCWMVSTSRMLYCWRPALSPTPNQSIPNWFKRSVYQYNPIEALCQRTWAILCFSQWSSITGLCIYS